MDLFLIKVLLSFVIGGLYVPFALWISEKFGSKVGGIIVTLPSTFLISFLFIAWTQDQNAAVASLPIVPLVLAIDSLFIVVFVLLQTRGTAKALLGATLFWAFASLPLVLLHFNNMALSLLLAIPVFAIALNYLNRIPHKKVEFSHQKLKTLLFRGTLCGTVIATAVLLGKQLGPLWGGLFGNFPAAISSSLFLLSKTHDEKFAAAFGRAAVYGIIANTSFSISLYLGVPPYGIIIGTVAAYLVAVAAGAITYKIAK